ncbi:MAG TPA: DNA cytosine methyltransferase [Bryobacteraceae bacterium]|nr:DNA cytosine methyltransferase [Bryobacteraceae bacterium]
MSHHGSRGSDISPSVIELFCGAGGTSFGFSRAGFDIRLGLDIAEHAVQTFMKNHPGAVGLPMPIQKAKGRQLLKAAGLHSVDVLLGGPSCQGYSTMGKRIEDDPRNYLYTHYIRIVRELQPRWILFENVKGMRFHGGGKFFRQLCDALRRLGYDIAHSVINAANYGVPQRRERVLIIGTNTGKGPCFPNETHHDPRCPKCSKPDGSNRIRSTKPRGPSLFLEGDCILCGGTRFDPNPSKVTSPWVSLWDAIGDLPVLGDRGGTDGFKPYSSKALSDYQCEIRRDSKGYTLHRAKGVSDLALSVIRMIPEGKGIRAINEVDLPERFRIMRRISNGSLRQDCTTLYHRLSRDLPSYTITCSFTNVASGAFCHPLANRAITIREAARLQSFPDQFEFVPTRLKDQIGNAVPPLLAEVLAEHIMSLIAGTKRRASQAQVVKQKRSQDWRPRISEPLPLQLLAAQDSLTEPLQE